MVDKTADPVAGTNCSLKVTGNLIKKQEVLEEFMRSAII